MNVCFCGIVDFEWIDYLVANIIVKRDGNQNDYKIVKSKEGKMGSNIWYERGVKVLLSEMILIYHLYPIIIGGTKRKIVGGNLKNW